MRPLLRALTLAFFASCLAPLAHAGEPSFTVRCKHTAGPKILPKYGTYYFFLKEGQVKGYACSLPGRPCEIISKNQTMIVFQTPGEHPDTLSIDLRTGTIQHRKANGLHATFACRQIPNNS
jgi:hypothetical protein